MKKYGKRITFAAIATGVVLAAAVAFAAWTATGSGTGSAQAGSAAGVEVTAGTPAGSLYPSGSADVAVTIHNPNAFPVHVSSIDLDTSGAQNGGTASTYGIEASDSSCNVDPSVTFTSQDNSAAGWDLAADDGSAGGSDEAVLNLADAISMDNTANDDCQSNTFTVYLTATATS